MKKISLFDLDHTLLNSNCAYQFGKYLYKQKAFSLFTMLRVVILYGLHKAGFLSIFTLQKMIFSRLFYKIPCQPIYDHAHKFIEQHFPTMLYQPVVDRLQNAQQQGQFTVLLSSSPDFLVKLFAKRLQVDAWDATRYETHQGVFTHISHLIQGEAKARSLRFFLQQLDIPAANATAYTDSHHDIPFLQAAGKAVIVNPDRKLLAWSKKNPCRVLFK